MGPLYRSSLPPVSSNRSNVSRQQGEKLKKLKPSQNWLGKKVTSLLYRALTSSSSPVQPIRSMPPGKIVPKKSLGNRISNLFSSSFSRSSKVNPLPKKDLPPLNIPRSTSPDSLPSLSSFSTSPSSSRSTSSSRSPSRSSLAAISPSSSSRSSSALQKKNASEKVRRSASTITSPASQVPQSSIKRKALAPLISKRSSPVERISNRVSTNVYTYFSSLSIAGLNPKADKSNKKAASYNLKQMVNKWSSGVVAFGSRSNIKKKAEEYRKKGVEVPFHLRSYNRSAVRQAFQGFIACNCNWHTLKEKVKSGDPVAKKHMGVINQFREIAFDQVLSRAKEDLLEDLIRPPFNLTEGAAKKIISEEFSPIDFGSVNLTSDKDVSLAFNSSHRSKEVLIVKHFNRNFREMFGSESAVFFDVNAYTSADPDAVGIHRDAVPEGRLFTRNKAVRQEKKYHTPEGQKVAQELNAVAAFALLSRVRSYNSKTFASYFPDQAGDKDLKSKADKLNQEVNQERDRMVVYLNLKAKHKIELRAARPHLFSSRLSESQLRKNEREIDAAADILADAELKRIPSNSLSKMAFNIIVEKRHAGIEDVVIQAENRLHEKLKMEYMNLEDEVASDLVERNNHINGQTKFTSEAEQKTYAAAVKAYGAIKAANKPRIKALKKEIEGLKKEITAAGGQAVNSIANKGNKDALSKAKAALESIRKENREVRNAIPGLRERSEAIDSKKNQILQLRLKAMNFAQEAHISDAIGAVKDIQMRSAGLRNNDVYINALQEITFFVFDHGEHTKTTLMQRRRKQLGTTALSEGSRINIQRSVAIETSKYLDRITTILGFISENDPSLLEGIVEQPEIDRMSKSFKALLEMRKNPGLDPRIRPGGSPEKEFNAIFSGGNPNDIADRVLNIVLGIVSRHSGNS